MNTDEIQKIQEDGYDFPYHHVPLYRKIFSQCFNWTWGINYVSTIEFLIDKIKQEEFESLVDIGCGDGRLTKELTEEFKNKDVEGIDYSEKAITLAKLMHPQGKYHCIDILNTHFNKKYDIALLIEVFEHIPPEISDTFLSAVARLMNKDGTLLLTVPHINAPLDPKHYRHFSVETLSSCLDKYFNIVEIVPFEKIDKRKEVIDLLLTNKLFILNSKRLNQLIYNYYKKNLFFADKEDLCKRIYIKAKIK
jgi:2-polyprenyl-3-methyl-5-hydroxy-6-metoxy-1,4-benzoquinol methylase